MADLGELLTVSPQPKAVPAEAEPEAPASPEPPRRIAEPAPEPPEPPTEIDARAIEGRHPAAPMQPMPTPAPRADAERAPAFDEIPGPSAGPPERRQRPETNAKRALPNLEGAVPPPGTRKGRAGPLVVLALLAFAAIGAGIYLVGRPPSKPVDVAVAPPPPVVVAEAKPSGRPGAAFTDPLQRRQPVPVLPGDGRRPGGLVHHGVAGGRGRA